MSACKGTYDVFAGVGAEESAKMSFSPLPPPPLLSFSLHVQAHAAPTTIAIYGVPTPWDLILAWWHCQERLWPRQPPAPDPTSRLLDSLLRPGTGSFQRKILLIVLAVIMTAAAATAVAAVSRGSRLPGSKVEDCFYVGEVADANDIVDNSSHAAVATCTGLNSSLKTPQLNLQESCQTIIAATLAGAVMVKDTTYLILPLHCTDCNPLLVPHAVFPYVPSENIRSDLSAKPPRALPRPPQFVFHSTSLNSFPATFEPLSPYRTLCANVLAPGELDVNAANPGSATTTILSANRSRRRPRG
ncbi:unnamed protein product [Schistocephalus solidus]|uniref:AAI domain-containing protein n=1 Tax=Schistocephalus solidus TaxID=70667 RepID=A0A183SU25_SCHSO|nr:unnamed protein product [Schistocephalus solidus]